MLKQQDYGQDIGPIAVNANAVKSMTSKPNEWQSGLQPTKKCESGCNLNILTFLESIK